MKYFTEHLPATFIYAGIDVERCGVFTGTRGRQLAGRCGLICTGAFPYRDEWAQLGAPLEATLRLHRHEPGSLAAQAKYLHQRTGGMIGSLTHLIRGAAIRAILGGQEALTGALDDPAAILHHPDRSKQHEQERLAAAAGQPVARIARLWWPDPAFTCATPQAPPDAAPGLPPVHRPLRHHRAGILILRPQLGPGLAGRP